MPIEKEIHEEKRRTLITQGEGVRLYRLRDLGREVIVLEGSEPTAVGGVLMHFLDALRKVLLLNEEPMVNIAGFHEVGKWYLAIFPRRRHRPNAFYREGNGRVVVSPGVIDMGGLIITPLEKDFNWLDATAVEEIYREVSLEEKTVERAIVAMR